VFKLAVQDDELLHLSKAINIHASMDSAIYLVCSVSIMIAIYTRIEEIREKDTRLESQSLKVIDDWVNISKEVRAILNKVNGRNHG